MAFEKAETVIHLGPTLLMASCDQPGGSLRVALSTPPYLILLRVELSCFHSSGSPGPPVPGTKLNALDILSVPLVLTLRWRGITPYATLRSPDFPPLRIGATACPCEVVRYKMEKEISSP